MQFDLNEQKIKNSLHSFALQDFHYRSQQLDQTFKKKQFLQLKSNSFKEVSDWSNRYPSQQQILKRPKSNKNIQKITDFSMFLQSQVVQEQPQSIPTQRKNVRLNPITMKFGIKSLQSKKKYKSKEEQARTSIYQKQYSPLNILYERKLKDNLSQNHSKPKKQQKEETFQFEEPKSIGFNSNYKRPAPKTQRLMIVLRQMKRNQPFKAFDKIDRLQNLIKLP